MKTLYNLAIGITIAVCVALLAAFVVYEMSWCYAWTEPFRSKLPCKDFAEAMDRAVKILITAYFSIGGVMILLGLDKR